jgi:uncharacterized membrane protein
MDRDDELRAAWAGVSAAPSQRSACVSLNWMRVSRTALLLLVAVAVFQLVHHYPEMPETMGSHFDGAGNPNGYQSRDGFFVLSAGMLALVVVLFTGLGFLFRILPAKSFNVPNRDYWLAPERRDATIDFMTRQLEWFGVATVVLLLVVLQGVFEANRAPEPRLEATLVWWVLGGYFLYTAVWLVRFLGYFRKPRTASS